jgi:16S rRNA G966 N2-methylase RsmD
LRPSAGILEKEMKVIPYKVEELLAKTCREEAFDIIFMDPPYGLETLPELVRLCRENGWLKPGGVILIEHGIREADLEGFNRKNYGDSSLSISVPTT